jgi:L-ascorbate metabolism protein UlaG (beta-lactamase superfamily)
VLSKAKAVVTTEEGAERLGGNSLGLSEWQSTEFRAVNGRVLRAVATPAHHGPEGLNRGAVNGFILFFEDEPEQVIYVSGDSVWYEGLTEIAQRFRVKAAILHLGAARVPEVGPFHLTMTAKEAVEAARSLIDAVIVPVHFEDWAHFSEGAEEIDREFANAGLTARLRWPERGRTALINLE